MKTHGMPRADIRSERHTKDVAAYCPDESDSDSDSDSDSERGQTRIKRSWGIF
jgi:hypothetical protein